MKAVALIVSLALGLLAAPLPAEAQQAAKVYRIGVLQSVFSSGFGAITRQGPKLLAHLLRDFGYVQRENLFFEPKTATATDEQLPELAAELVRLQVDLIVAVGTPATLAAKRTTRTIPIVMLVKSDPVRAGLVASFARPGGNITGLTALASELVGKRLGLLKETVPGLTRIAILWNPTDPDTADEWRETRAAARRSRVKLQSLEVRSPDDFESAFGAADKERADALLVLADRLISSHAGPIANLAGKYRLPAMYPERHFVAPHNGGLMYYGQDPTDFLRRVAALVDKIFRGAKPADLPVEQPTTFKFVINLKTANALGLTIPTSLLFQADRVIK